LAKSRYPPPWNRPCFIVRNANEQALAEQRRRAAIKLLNRDEARRKAAVTDVANNETHALHSRCGTKIEGCKLLRSRRSGLFSLD